MIKKFKMFFLEIRIRMYGLMYQHYKCKAMKYEHCIKMTKELDDKIYFATEYYKQELDS